MSFRLAGCGSSKRDRTQFSYMIKVRTRVFTQKCVLPKMECVKTQVYVGSRELYIQHMS